MAYDAIKKFPKQLIFEPKIENWDKLYSKQGFVVAGMGGSNLATELIMSWKPSLDIRIHRDYGLPSLPDSELKNKIIIGSSYSGNTEEVLDSIKKATSKNLSAAAISIGGELLKFAKLKKLPYIKIPDTNIKPREALGFSTVALLKMMGEEEALKDLKKVSKKLDIKKAEEEGKKLAKNLNGFIPIIYSSAKNKGLAYNWKIIFNENSKIPAFYNVFPELNHNETAGFDTREQTKKLSQFFHFIFLKDPGDNPRNTIQMEILKDIFNKKGLPVYIYELQGETIWEKFFSSLLLVNWASYYIALNYGFDSKEVESVERFKKILQSRL